MPTWLVTGGSGFLGRHLLDGLKTGRPEGVRVVAIGRRRPEGWSDGEFFPVDLDHRPAIDRALDLIQPDAAFHLAGRTPPASAEDLFRSNTMATIHLLGALRDSGRPCRVVLVGSASELGPVPIEELPVAEDYPCRPIGNYGLSKWLATSAGLAMRRPLEILVARVFNPIGPGLPGSQALGRFARELASGDGPVTLEVGDLEARRDFVDARDVARALISLALRGKPGKVYHVGRGMSERVGDGLDFLIGLSGRAVCIRVDPALAAHRGPDDSRADVRRISEETGWSAQIPWEQGLRDLWSEAIERARRG